MLIGTCRWAPLVIFAGRHQRSVTRAGDYDLGQSGIGEPLGDDDPAQQFRALPKVRLSSRALHRGKFGFNFGQHLWQGDRKWNECLVQIGRGHSFCLTSACIQHPHPQGSRRGPSTMPHDFAAGV